MAHLCVSCQALGIAREVPPDCCDRPIHVKVHVLPSEGDGLVKTCPFCGGDRGSLPDGIREFQTGEDAATAVMAEAIVRAMPHERLDKPAHGRRLLAFSDSRQRAAFFAPYLERTTA